MTERVALWAQELVDCKEDRHHWELIPNRRRAPWGQLMTRRCETCLSTREDVLDMFGDRNGSANYDYSPQYERLLEEYGHLTKADWRIVKIRKLEREGRRSELSGNGTTSIANLANEVIPIDRSARRAKASA